MESETQIKQIKEKLLKQPYYYIKYQPENIQEKLLKDENFVLKMIDVYEFSVNFLNEIAKTDKKIFKEKYNNIDFAKKAFVVTPFSKFRFSNEIQSEIEKDKELIKQMCLNSYYAFNYYENYNNELKPEIKNYIASNIYLKEILLDDSINLDFWLNKLDFTEILNNLKLNEKEFTSINSKINKAIENKEYQQEINNDEDIDNDDEVEFGR